MKKIIALSLCLSLFSVGFAWAQEGVSENESVSKTEKNVLSQSKETQKIKIASEVSEHLKADEKFVGDYFFAGDVLLVEGEIEGDLYVFANEVNLKGSVSGDVLAFVQVARLGGEIMGNARVGANEIFMTGEIKKNVSAVAGKISFSHKARVLGSFVASASEMLLDGVLGSDLNFSGWDLHLRNGKVGGDVNAAVAEISLKNNSVIEGDLNLSAENPVYLDKSSKIVGENKFSLLEKESAIWAYLKSAAWFFLGILLVGLAMMNFLRNSLSKGLLNLNQSFFKSLVFGVLFVLGMPLLVVLLLASFVGFYLGLVLLAFSVLLIVFAQLLNARIFGVILRDVLKLKIGEKNAWIHGLTVFSLICTAPVFGVAIFLSLTILSCGALIRTFLFGERF